MIELMNAMERVGWATMPGWVNDADSRRLRRECESAEETGEFHRAGVGAGTNRKVREAVRSDHVLWLQTGDLAGEQTLYSERLEVLRLALNERFFLGLFEFEGHFAIYPQGGFYKPHLDRPAGTHARIVTVILYLNPDWQPGDGGELRLWTTCGRQEGTFELIEPRMGTLVCFLAGDFWHEVLPANRTRMSITGWFSQR